mgnify:CR=1 FL=1
MRHTVCITLIKHSQDRSLLSWKNPSQISIRAHYKAEGRIMEITITKLSHARSLLPLMEQPTADFYYDSLKYESIFDGIKTLNEEDKLMCEGLLTIQECEQALKTFKANKSPGNEGITSEFYKETFYSINELCVHTK